MESQYITMIIKIVISLLLGLSLCIPSTQGAALMGGHFDNKNVTSSSLMNQNYSTEYTTPDRSKVSNVIVNKTEQKTAMNQNRPAYSSLPLSAEIAEPMSLSTQQKIKQPEEIPDPSPLILPGYNLPEHLFNNGKPFYVEKDPLTGKIDFNSKTPAGKVNDDEYEYFSDDSLDIYDKANIDRKDGSISSHRPNDVNQLTPNFHDFLNLPVKYNSDKYVYPLISSSYANTKIQGNVNNHKYSVTTYKPTLSPNYFNNNDNDAPTYYKTKVKDTAKNPADYGYNKPSYTMPATTTTTTRPTTTKMNNLMNSPMNHPSYETTEEDYDTDDMAYYSTAAPTNTYLTTRASVFTTTTTKRPMSLFEQLFGDYDEPKPSDGPTKQPPSLFANLPSNKQTFTNKFDNEVQPTNPLPPSTLATQKPTASSPSTTENHRPFSSSPQESSYEYEDYEEPSNPVNINVPPKEIDHPTASKYPIRPEYNSPPQRTTPKPELTTETTKYSSKVTPTMLNFNTIKHHAEEYESSSEYSDYEDSSKPAQNKTTEFYYNTITTPKVQTPKVTSLPLGENHLQNSHPPPIIALTNNLREQLNHERVESSTRPIPFQQNTYQPNYGNNFHGIPSPNIPKQPQPPMRSKPPSTSNIHIAPDQDTVSFVVGNQQNVEGHVNPAPPKANSSPYEPNPFRPVYDQPEKTSNMQNSVSYTVQAIPEMYKPQNFPESAGVGSTVNIQPIRNSEASLTIGMPINNNNNNNRKVIGQVMDEKLDLENDKFEYSRPPQSGSKIVFPEEKHSTYPPTIPHRPATNSYPSNNREVLKLNSKPMFHQLPSDLTPPNESEPPVPLSPPPQRMDRPRPPWDPRPGHFYNGRPEYARPPRPSSQKQNGDVYKRIDVLPNILPQFRPNANVKTPNSHFYDGHGPMNNGYLRQPLLERPSNRPIGFFEKLHPPPPPPPKRIQELRKGIPPMMERPQERYQSLEERVSHESAQKLNHDTNLYYQGPPKIHIANRRIGNLETEVETLQMIQAKEANKNEMKVNVGTSLKTTASGMDILSTEKPLYVVYPVNSSPMKLDVFDTDKKEAVVIGTRAELPLPPSKIKNDYNNMYDQKPLLNPKDRNDSPVLKPHPHPRPQNFPIKTDFPYALERPDPSVLNPPVPEVTANNGNNLENLDKYQDHKLDTFESSNQWSSVSDFGDNLEPKIVTGQKTKYNPDQISATLKTYTDKPIAVAYTPTEEYNIYLPTSEKYVMPNVRPGIVDNADIHEATVAGHSQSSEITVSAVMHTHPQADLATQHLDFINRNKQKLQKPLITEGTVIADNHKSDLDLDTSHVPTKLDFQAPFQASTNVDASLNQGWSIVKDVSKADIDRSDVGELTTLPVDATSEFDIENFKPQLFGGFKPLYSFSESDNSSKEGERQERKI